MFLQLSWPIIGLTAAMVFVVRPAAIWLATARSDLTWQEKALAGWIAPRGIVAAAVAGIAAQKLAGAHFPGSQEVMPAVFALIATTMILHGFSLAPLARKLKLTLGDRPGLAILGAAAWTVQLAKALKEGGTPVLLVDAFPNALKDARKAAIPVLQAEILSEHGEDGIGERRVDYLLAATPNDVYNSLVCAKLAPELGRSRVFQLAPIGDNLEEWTALKREWRGIVAGTPPLDIATMRKRYKDGWRFELRDPIEAKDDEDVDEADVKEARGETFILFVRRNGDLAFGSPEGAELTGGVGDRALVLAEPVGDGATNEAQAREPA